jgi:hypothetical protein
MTVLVTVTVAGALGPPTYGFVVSGTLDVMCAAPAVAVPESDVLGAALAGPVRTGRVVVITYV